MYKYGGFEIFHQCLEEFLCNLVRDTGDCQITEITLKSDYFDRTRAYLMDRFRTLTDEPKDGIVSITLNTQCGSICLKRADNLGADKKLWVY